MIYCASLERDEFVYHLVADKSALGKIVSLACLKVSHSDLAGETLVGSPYLYLALTKYRKSDFYLSYVASEMLNRGQDVDSRDAYGLTLLMKAVIDVNADAVRFLLENRANKDLRLEDDSPAQEFRGMSALEIARSIKKNPSSDQAALAAIIELLGRK